MPSLKSKVKNPEDYGFTQGEWDSMQAIFEKYPEITKVILFGSRAKKTFKKASDVDLVVCGKNVTHSTIARLQGEFEESTIPYFYDVLDKQNISSPELKEHIRKYGKVIYEKIE